MNPSFIDIDFIKGLPSHSIVDKKSGVRVNLGNCAPLPKEHATIIKNYGSALLGIQDKGMGQDRLDQLCNFMVLNCESLGLELLVTKSDRHFDSQWYFLGNIEGLLRAASQGTIRPPFGPAVHDRIASALQVLNQRSN